MLFISFKLFMQEKIVVPIRKMFRKFENPFSKGEIIAKF